MAALASQPNRPEDPQHLAVVPKEPLSVSTWWNQGFLAGTQATGALRQSLQAMWGLGLKASLLSLKPYVAPLSFEAYQAYHLCVELPVGEQSIRLSLSVDAAAVCLGQALGPTEFPAQRLDHLTPLEGLLLQRFSHDCLQAVQADLMAEQFDLDTPAELLTDAWVEWTWLLRSSQDETESGRLAVSVPAAWMKRVEPPLLELPAINADFFATSPMAKTYCPVTVKVGVASLPLMDLEALEAEDLLILHGEQWSLVQPVTGVNFPVQSCHEHLESFTLDLPEGEADVSNAFQSDPTAQASTGTYQSASLWDSLEIDVDACFTPVKIPLQQLRSMEEGLLIEVGDLVQHQINLQVNGQTLAHGQLVSVGDQYGVLVTEVLQKEQQARSSSESAAATDSVPEVNLPAVEGDVAGEVAALPADSSAAEAYDPAAVAYDENAYAPEGSEYDPSAYAHQGGEAPLGTPEQEVQRADELEEAMSEIDELLNQDEMTS